MTTPPTDRTTRRALREELARAQARVRKLEREAELSKETDRLAEAARAEQDSARRADRERLAAARAEVARAWSAVVDARFACGEPPVAAALGRARTALEAAAEKLGMGDDPAPSWAVSAIAACVVGGLFYHGLARDRRAGAAAPPAASAPAAPPKPAP